MRIKDFAKELGVPPEIVLEKLKSMRLKAKGPDQEINAAVLVVLKSSADDIKALAQKKLAEVEAVALSTEDKAKTEAKEGAKPGKTKKATAKKAVTKKTIEKATTKKTTKKTTTKKTVKKAVKTTTKKAPAKESATQKTAKKTSSKKEPLKLKTTIIKRPKTKTAKKTESSKPASSAAKQLAVVKPGPEKEEAAAGGTVLPEAVEPKKETGKMFQAPVQAGEKGELEVQLPITVKELAVRLQEKPSVLLKKLMQAGIFANINKGLDEELVRKIIAEYGYSLAKVKTQEELVIDQHIQEKEDPGQLKSRAPVITFMGHVDHGKTTLLDQIRKSRIVDQEHGGITQHISAYSVSTPKGSITFLDTPGHEAFTAMRARGAHITDLVVVVIAADEGIMPQTEEAIDHARAAKVPIVVALNKIDKRNADIDRVKRQLADHDLTPEDWGGKTVVVPVSAVTGEGVDQLLEMILLESELLELRANPYKKASGIVVEAELTHGRGAVATIIVQNGTLNEGDFLIVGPYYAKIKAMFNDRRKPIKTAGPSMPVEILGLNGVPEAGEAFYVVEDERTAKSISDKRVQKAKEEKLHSSQRITLEDVYHQIQEGKIKELNIILKADVQGSVEALKDSLVKLSTDEVKLNFIHSGVGVVNASDVILAAASNAIIIAFNTGLGPRAKSELEKTQVDVRTYRIIYDAINDIKNALEGLLEPKKKKMFLARIEVRDVFKLSKAGTVAGCFVTKGKVPRKANIDVLRNGEIVYSGHISSLKRFKDDVRDVSEGFECGITLDNFTDYQVGDIMEAYDIETITRKL